MTPEFPIDPTPRLQFFKQLSYIAIQIPHRISNMMANQLTPTIETHITLNTLDVGLHGVGQATIASEKVHFNNWYSKWPVQLMSDYT